MIQIDMKMPKRCCDCRLCDMCGYCKALLKYVLTEDNYNVRAEDWKNTLMVLSACVVIFMLETESLKTLRLK